MPSFPAGGYVIVFVCAGCGAELTAPLSQVALPAHAHQTYGNGVQLPVLMEPGTFAVESESESWGPSWPSREKGAPDAADVISTHASADGLLPGDVTDSFVIAPGDTRGTVLIPEKSSGHCCGLDGADGPNMACEACGLPVASRIDDCSLWQAVWLAPNAVHRQAVGDPGPTPLPWADATATAVGTPPYEPITSWGGPGFGLYHWWSWSPRWEAAAGRALAHLLAASGGRSVSVPHGLTADVFQRALDALLSTDGPTLHAALAGPDLPAPDTDADLLLVPEHPQTGETWAPARDTSAYLVPLPLGVWLWLAFPEPHLPADPPPQVLPVELLRDDPPSPRPGHLFRIDAGVFRHTLLRLPTACDPWLREVLENLPTYVRTGLF
ncbi:hypothetical protein KBZ94_19770 [Streptomyces sp. RM72]|uniref:hypothetical protein n=1 Tax=Streptomyces sp. RM72 TaxID=1115510 RepID=UPI001B36F27C|nr:hypothetical protein [Streptomyces sp. RM72]MBQ0887148.1 hypothetical protein [Streptomyces sp. RM72]